jgi:hypothetical protein
MNQALYAHMNNKRKREKNKNKMPKRWLGTFKTEKKKRMQVCFSMYKQRSII